VTEQPVTIADASDVPQERGSSGFEPRTTVMLIAGFAGVALLIVTALLPVKYAVLHPGPVLNTLGKADGKSLIAITGRATYPTSGTLDLTTVSVVGGPDRPISLIQVIGGWLDRTAAVVPEEEIFPVGVTQQQSDDENKAEMVSSQESATAAALGTLGIAVPTTLTVAQVDKTSPAYGQLEASDVILNVNGQAISDLTQLRSTLQTVTAGNTVQVTVRRKGVSQTVTAKTAASTDDGHTVLGVYINPAFTFPFSVKIQIEDIGGPSAGMMFALGIIDTLTPGDLTGGKQIAGTGTIDADGTVGPIGGIRQKLVGARHAGARYFIAPADNCNEVRGHIPSGLQVIKTATLTQSRNDVEAIAAGKVSSLAGC
jgi:PDZ domain-containing protein